MNFEDGLCYVLSKLRLSNLQLKNEQKQAIHAIYGGKDVCVYLPTGFGNSIWFQILPFLFNHTCGLVGGMKRSCANIVYPLIALTVDQVRNLRKRGVQAVMILCDTRESSVVGKEFLAMESSVTSASHIFTSPEALSHTKWREALNNPLVFI